MFRRLPYILLLLHVYVAWRLLPDLAVGSIVFAATALWLAASASAMPLWPAARRIVRQPLKDRLTIATMLAIGAFSSLLALTLARDIALLVSAIAGAGSVQSALRSGGAIAVPVLAAAEIGRASCRERG